MSEEDKNRRAWKVRIGQADSAISEYLGKNNVVIDYELKNLAFGMNKEEVTKIVKGMYHNDTEKRISAHIGQIFRILNEIKAGDLLVVPIRKSKEICIAQVDYSTQPIISGTQIIFSVCWLKTEIPIKIFDQDLRYSFMAIMKVCEVTRNSAVERLLEIANNSV